MPEPFPVPPIFQGKSPGDEVDHHHLMTIIGIIIVVIIATTTDFTLVLCIGDREGLGTRWNGGDHKK